MRYVDGELDYHVWVLCPECKESMDLVDQDSDHFLAACIFGNSKHGPDWQNTGLHFVCPFCETKFELGDIKY